MNDVLHLIGRDQPLFLERIGALKARGIWTRDELVELFHTMIPEFGHKEMGNLLDEKM